MWQYSSTGRVPGIAVNIDVDLDECYVDYPKIIKSGGFNGFPKSQKPAPAEPAKPAGSPKGDLNGDGKVDIEDVAALVNHINGVKPLE
jgi:GH25 family lysozyme M1 (1,4-beta-N-acetylmuramidase)